MWGVNRGGGVEFEWVSAILNCGRVVTVEEHYGNGGRFEIVYDSV